VPTASEVELESNVCRTVPQLESEQTWNVTLPVIVASGPEKVAVTVGVVELTRTVSAGVTSAGTVGVELTVTEELVFAVFAGSLMSLTVTVDVEAVFRSVTEKVFVPATRAAFDGSVAWASFDVIPRCRSS